MSLYKLSSLLWNIFTKNEVRQTGSPLYLPSSNWINNGSLLSDSNPTPVSRTLHSYGNSWLAAAYDLDTTKLSLLTKSPGWSSVRRVPFLYHVTLIGLLSDTGSEVNFTQHVKVSIFMSSTDDVMIGLSGFAVITIIIIIISYIAP